MTLAKNVIWMAIWYMAYNYLDWRASLLDLRLNLNWKGNTACYIFFLGNVSTQCDLDERQLPKSCLVTTCSSKSFAYTKAARSCTIMPDEK